jgi:UDP-GlcNAc:undecaprenyl-phosphate GlcNAc-1-phosphate transferase
MPTHLEFTASLILAFAGCTGAMIWLARRGHWLGLLDRPGGRKQHAVPTPRVGGLAMAAGLALAGSATTLWPLSAWITAGLAATLALGVLDDRKAIPARHKLVAQVLIAGCSLAGSGLVLPNVGELVPGWSPSLGWLALPISVFGVVSVMNALNMADGLDGLAGSLSLSGFAGLGCAALAANQLSAFTLCALSGAVLIAFLGFNLRWGSRQSAHVFMGDAGSLSVGYLLAAVALMLCTHPTRPVPPGVVLWSVALPLLDGLSVIVARYRAQRPLTLPGRDHLHYRLVDFGFSVNTIVLCECALALLGVAAALSAWNAGLPEWLLSTAFALCAAVYLTVFSLQPQQLDTEQQQRGRRLNGAPNPGRDPIRARSGSPSSRSS